MCLTYNKLIDINLQHLGTLHIGVFALKLNTQTIVKLSNTIFLTPGYSSYNNNTLALPQIVHRV